MLIGPHIDVTVNCKPGSMNVCEKSHHAMTLHICSKIKATIPKTEKSHTWFKKLRENKIYDPNFNCTTQENGWNTQNRFLEKDTAKVFHDFPRERKLKLAP